MAQNRCFVRYKRIYTNRENTIIFWFAGGGIVARRHTRIDRRRWARLRRQVFRRDGWRCRACGRAGRLECDHVTPLDAGGDPYALANLQALCRGCHIAKTERENRARAAAEFPGQAAWRAAVDELLPNR